MGRYVRIQADGFCSLVLYRVDFHTNNKKMEGSSNNAASWNVAHRMQPNFVATKVETHDRAQEDNKITQELE